MSCLAQGDQLWGTKNLIPGKEELGRELIEKGLGSGFLGPLRGRRHSGRDLIHSASRLLQVECNSKLDPTQTSFLKVSNLFWAPVHSHISSLHAAAKPPGPCMGANGVNEEQNKGARAKKLGKRDPFHLSAWLIYVCFTFSGWRSPEQMADSGGQPQLTQVSAPAVHGMGKGHRIPVALGSALCHTPRPHNAAASGSSSSSNLISPSPSPLLTSAARQADRGLQVLPARHGLQ